MLNISKTVLYKRVKKISIATVRGVPLIAIEKVKKENVYIVTPINFNNIFNVGRIESDPEVTLKLHHPLATARGVITYWCLQYEERYGCKYTPNWAIETSYAKKLLRAYSPDRLQEIIDVVMRLYDTKWKSQQFLRPSLGQLSSWLAQQVEPFATANVVQPQQELVNLDGADIIDKFDQCWDTGDGR